MGICFFSEAFISCCFEPHKNSREGTFPLIFPIKRENSPLGKMLGEFLYCEQHVPALVIRILLFFVVIASGFYGKYVVNWFGMMELWLYLRYNLHYETYYDFVKVQVVWMDFTINIDRLFDLWGLEFGIWLQYLV